MQRVRKNSALVFILKGLMPYSRENMMLSFSPNRFFNELERTSGYKRKTLDETIRRAKKQGLMEKAGPSLRLTALGRRVAEPYIAKQLKNGGKLMIIFDVPENQAAARQKLRSLLRKWGFEQTQKSVWITEYDHRESVRQAVEELGLAGCVELYECARLFPAR